MNRAMSVWISNACGRPVLVCRAMVEVRGKRNKMRCNAMRRVTNTNAR